MGKWALKEGKLIIIIVITITSEDVYACMVKSLNRRLRDSAYGLLLIYYFNSKYDTL